MTRTVIVRSGSVNTMCNDFDNNIPYSDYLAAFSQTRIRVPWPSRRGADT
jgi:hypothetical protein